MTTYTVTWHIDLPAASPGEAARQALAIHRDPTSIATCFEVRPKDDEHGQPVTIDLMDSGKDHR